MRPHRLEVTAFGAFAEPVTVDFDDLAAGGLFLLHGETGAGKSTLLDALGFALYGRVPGARGTARRLRSDHADAGVRTEVRLEVTLGGRRLRITRSPEQSRPKRRGTGTTTEPAKVLLEERAAAGWAAVSTRAGEADQEIADRLGMSAEQFWQVILLPQGEFASFLRAASEDRARLLKKLFGTERYRHVEDWLADRRRAAAAGLDAQREEVRVRAARVAQIAEVDSPDGIPDELWGTDLACSHAAAVGVAARVATAAEEALGVARDRAEATRALAARQARRREATQQARALAGAEGEISSLAIEAGRAAAAAEVAPLLDALARAERALDEAGAIDRRARERTADAGAEPGGAPGALRAAAQELDRRHGRLGDLRSVAAEADAEDAAAAGSLAVERELAGHLVAAAARMAELGDQRAARRAARDEARAAAQALPAAARAADLLGAAAVAATDLAGAESAAAELRVRHLDAREGAAALRDVHHELRRARYDAMIAELAAKLADGDPCPVCGSLDHPDPSEVHADRVTLEQEEQAAAAAEDARARAEAIGQELAGAVSRADGLRATLAGLGAASAALGGHGRAAAGAGVEPTALAAAAAAAAGRRDVLAARAGRATELDAALAEADEALAELGRMCAAATEQQGAAARDAAAARARADAHRATLADRLQGAPDLAAALADAAEGAAALASAAAARERLEAAEAARSEAAGTAAAGAVQAGFTGCADAATATRTAPWRGAAAERVAAHRTAADGVAALLADPDLDVPLMPPADLEAAAAAVVAAAGAHDRSVAALAQARARSAQLERRAPELTSSLRALAPLATRAEQVRALADLVAGQGANTRRMTLSAFVLAARLEEVAAVAGERLLRMTQGRYSLVHTDAGRGNRKAGLGLLARDSWTGVDRDTATLSGGETFLASLALALALADVVCAEAGGTRLESLFVDEGFGSLDSDTLDEVMDVLDGLREGGRVVGVVSHVAELRARIPARVHVHKHPTGSTISVVA